MKANNYLNDLGFSDSFIDEFEKYKATVDSNPIEVENAFKGLVDYEDSKELTISTRGEAFSSLIINQ